MSIEESEELVDAPPPCSASSYCTFFLVFIVFKYLTIPSSPESIRILISPVSQEFLRGIELMSKSELGDSFCREILRLSSYANSHIDDNSRICALLDKSPHCEKILGNLKARTARLEQVLGFLKKVQVICNAKETLN